jgi:hypothetical protein
MKKYQKIREKQIKQFMPYSKLTITERIKFYCELATAQFTKDEAEKILKS